MEKIEQQGNQDMYPDDLIERAVQSATHCEAQGFVETAKSLRALAEEMRATQFAAAFSCGFAEDPCPAPWQSV